MSYTDIKALILNITNIDLDCKIFNEKKKQSFYIIFYLMYKYLMSNNSL